MGRICLCSARVIYAVLSMSGSLAFCLWNNHVEILQRSVTMDQMLLMLKMPERVSGIPNYLLKEEKNKQQQQQKTVLRAMLHVSEYLTKISYGKDAYSLICKVSGMKK